MMPTSADSGAGRGPLASHSGFPTNRGPTSLVGPRLVDHFRSAQADAIPVLVYKS